MSAAASMHWGKARNAYNKEAQSLIRAKYLQSFLNQEMIPRWALNIELYPSFLAELPLAEHARRQAGDTLNWTIQALNGQAMEYGAQGNDYLLNLQHIYGANKEGFCLAEDELRSLVMKDTQDKQQQLYYHMPYPNHPLTDEEIVRSLCFSPSQDQWHNRQTSYSHKHNHYRHPTQFGNPVRSQTWRRNLGMSNPRHMARATEACPRPSPQSPHHRALSTGSLPQSDMMLTCPNPVLHTMGSTP